jgi:glutathione synthase
VSALRTDDLPRRTVQIDDLDVLLLRANPIDTNLLALAMIAEDAGVRVLNPPAAILRTANKAWLATLSDVPRPATVVTRALPTLSRFAEGLRGGVVVKPARGCGGRDVSFVRRGAPRGLADALARTEAGGVHAVAQAWLPEAEHGEKRLLWLDGTLRGGYLRVRAPGELRHNLKVGGQPHATTLDEADARIQGRDQPARLGQDQQRRQSERQGPAVASRCPDDQCRGIPEDRRCRAAHPSQWRAQAVRGGHGDRLCRPDALARPVR